jgi:hypothetical protein
LQWNKPGKVRAEPREIHMTADDEDLPVKYLLYVVAVIIVIAVAAVSTFMIFLR